MSNKGWHLDMVGFFYYIFKKGKPHDYIYKFDFKVLNKSNMDDYISIFKDSGWVFVLT